MFLNIRQCIVAEFLKVFSDMLPFKAFNLKF